MRDFITSVEKLVEREKAEKQQSLMSLYKSKQMSPRTYNRKKMEVEKWASRRRQDVAEKRRLIAN